MANFVGNIWCSVGTIYVSSDVRIKTNILNVNDDTALDKTLNIQPETYEYKDVIDRGTQRVWFYITTNRRNYSRGSFYSKRDILTDKN
jgi:hypothetical protein